MWYNISTMEETPEKEPSKTLTVLWWMSLPIVLAFALGSAGMSGWLYCRCDFQDWAAILQVMVYAFVLGRFAAMVCRMTGIKNEIFAFLFGAAVGLAAEYGYWFWMIHKLHPETWVYLPTDLYAEARAYATTVVSSICGVRISGLPIRLWFYAEGLFVILGTMFVALGCHLDLTEPKS